MNKRHTFLSVPLGVELCSLVTRCLTMITLIRCQRTKCNLIWLLAVFIWQTVWNKKSLPIYGVEIKTISSIKLPIFIAKKPFSLQHNSTIITELEYIEFCMSKTRRLVVWIPLSVIVCLLASGCLLVNNVWGVSFLTMHNEPLQVIYYVKDQPDRNVLHALVAFNNNIWRGFLYSYCDNGME